MKPKYILIGVGVLVVAGGIAYYFLSKKKINPLGIYDEGIKVDGGVLTGATMSNPPIQNQQPFRQTGTIRSMRSLGVTPISSSAIPKKKG